jgi:hypothetical protein
MLNNVSPTAEQLAQEAREALSRRPAMTPREHTNFGGALIPQRLPLRLVPSPKPSPGQVASVIVQDYLRSGLSRCKEPAESLTATAPIHEQIAAVEVAASEIKHDVDSRMQDLVAALQREREEQS